MASLKRWRAAQRYEQAYWQQSAARIAGGAASRLDWYAWRADQLANYLRQLGFAHLADGDAQVIEIGSGPVGTIAYFPAKVRVAVDPLEPFYSRDRVLTELRPSGVRYLEGVGESLPCETAMFDVAIIDNCIDHVRDVHATMAEITRVLQPGGVLYLSVNCRTPWGFVVHRMLSRLRIDAGHPHTFTPRRARALVANHPLKVVQLTVDSPVKARADDRAAPELKARLKAFLGTSEFAVRLVARRIGGTPQDHPVAAPGAPSALPA